jgi:aspartyl/glutamyl-tRNA(Asn/Gln) amidotransferase C subunit
MVTRDDILKIAALAKLYISEEKLDEITNDLNGVIAFADTIASADASGYDTDAAGNESLPLRCDAVTPSFMPKLILSNAMESGDGFFIVRERKS